MPTDHTIPPAAYLQLTRRQLLDKGEEGLNRLENCRLCPRQCEANRVEGNTGFCQTGRRSLLASFQLHFGEEAPLVGNQGSGTLFFSGCNLGCVFCQNVDISQDPASGAEVQADQLAEAMLRLQEQGALNINLVTPTHVVPQILEALVPAREAGLRLPLVYNCGGYESLETLELLEGVVDIYMPDIKFANPRLAEKYCRATDYPQRARAALREMHRQTGDLRIDDRGAAFRGLLVRHLLMPGELAGSEEWFAFLASEISENTYLNIMDQYRPCARARLYPELQSGLSREEYEQALHLAKSYGLTRLDQRNQRSLQAFFRRLQ